MQLETIGNELPNDPTKQLVLFTGEDTNTNTDTGNADSNNESPMRIDPEDGDAFCAGILNTEETQTGDGSTKHLLKLTPDHDAVELIDFKQERDKIAEKTPLSPREAEVQLLTNAGAQRQRISELLGPHPNTITNYRTDIRNKKQEAEAAIEKAKEAARKTETVTSGGLLTGKRNE